MRKTQKSQFLKELDVEFWSKQSSAKYETKCFVSSYRYSHRASKFCSWSPFNVLLLIIVIRAITSLDLGTPVLESLVVSQHNI